MTERDPGKESGTWMSKSRLTLLTVLFVTMAAGFFLVRSSLNHESGSILKQAMDIARTAEASLSKEAIAALHGAQTDEAKPEYWMIKSSLEKIVGVNSDFAFAYIYTQKEGKIYFIADSEPADSQDYSPPGQEYTEADEETKMPFETGEPLATKPATDRWGTWISMLVPMKDNLSGKVTAVFGMDYPAQLWTSKLNSHAVQGALYVAGLMLLITAFYMITRRNRTLRESEALIRQSDDKNRILTDVTIEGIVIQKDSKIVEVNPSILRMFGYERSEVIGREMLAFICEEDRLALKDNILANSPLPSIVSAVRKNGEKFIVSIEGRECEMNGEKLRAASVRDITLQKQAEDALKESNARIRAITDSAQDGIIMMDQDGLVSYWNPSAQRILGYASDEVIGRNLHELMVPKRHHAMHFAAFPAFQTSGEGAAIGKTLDMEAIRKDGTEIPVQLSLSAVRLSSGWHSVGIVRDITQQKKAEAELIKAKEMAETATRSKSAFLANMSHEIRTPMNAVIGFSGLMAKTDMTPKQQDYIRKIDSSARALLGIINDILDFSKIEAGKLEIESVNFQLGDVINSIVEMVAVKAAEKNVELLSFVNSNVPGALVGDPLRLGQILVNLASNAVKFTEKGHILIKAELLSQDAESCRIKFSVHDTGIGMTAEQVESMFTAFSQADSSITRRFGGTGLGLTISKRLAEMMDGEISVQSQPGVGSTFTYAASFRQQMQIRENKAPGLENLRKLRVLIVDDNDMARTILSEQLAALGIHAVQADSGQAAIGEIRRASPGMPFDLVLMDLRMPGMDGLEAARRILADRDIIKHPLIFMISAFGREEIVKMAEKMGIRTFLMKPVNPELLRDTLLQAFGETAAETAAHASGKAHADVRAQGLRILLVEDNVLNQEVATEILSSAGISVEVANNGKEAVEAVAASVYDIVLMDVQMPVMGGYEATKRIRAIGQYKDLPIIAMTAHAMQGAREECLEAGMNDYISKPIDPDSLFLTIRKWVKPGAAVDRAPAASAAKIPGKQEEPVSLPQGLPGIDIEAGLRRLGGNRKLYRKLLLDFAGAYCASFDDIDRALRQGDTALALRLIHTLKGVAGNISAYGIQQLSAELEKALAGNKAGDAERLLADLGEAVRSMKSALEGILGPEPAAGVQSEGTYDTQKAQTLLRDLARLIWEDNVNAEQTLEEFQNVIGPSVYGEDIKALADSIGDYDFDAAKAALQRIADKMNIDVGGN